MLQHNDVATLLLLKEEESGRAIVVLPPVTVCKYYIRFASLSCHTIMDVAPTKNAAGTKNERKKKQAKAYRSSQELIVA